LFIAKGAVEPLRQARARRRQSRGERVDPVNADQRHEIDSQTCRIVKSLAMYGRYILGNRNSSRNLMPFIRLIRHFKREMLLVLLCAGALRFDPVLGQNLIGEFQEAPERSNSVFEYEIEAFDAKNYQAAVENLLGIYERSNDRYFTPGSKGKVGLKVYSNSGPGLSTPEALVEALVKSLIKRGYKRSDIFIIGLHGRMLRESGFLPPLSHRSMLFNKVFVRSLDSGEYYDEKWFYDSPLPAKSSQYWINIDEENAIGKKSDESRERKSYLPMPLMHEVDFWVNLPCYSDHPTLGINGALMNATLWNASNTTRFLRSPASAPVAVAEMGAVPELRETWALNIVSLQRFQYVGGPIFNSMYTVSEPLVMLSDNPVLLDSIMSERINKHRKKNGFAPLPQELKILAYSEQLGLGAKDTSFANLISAN